MGGKIDSKSARGRRHQKAKLPGLFAGNAKLVGIRSGVDPSEVIEGLKVLDKSMVELFMADRAMRHPDISPTAYLRDVRGFSTNMAYNIVNEYPLAVWDDFKNQVVTAITQRVVDRNAEVVVKTIESYITAAALTKARAMEILKLPVQTKAEYVTDPATGKREKLYGLTAKMVRDCTEAIDVSEKIFRRSMGLPAETPLEQMRAAAAGRTTNINIQINNGEQPKAAPSPETAILDQLSYDQIWEMIELKRKMLSQAKEEKAVESVVEPKPEGAKGD